MIRQRQGADSPAGIGERVEAAIVRRAPSGLSCMTIGVSDRGGPSFGRDRYVKIGAALGDVHRSGGWRRCRCPVS